jgi:hypothetical protein
MQQADAEGLLVVVLLSFAERILAKTWECSLFTEATDLLPK